MIHILVIVPYPGLETRAEKALRELARPGIECRVTHLIGTRVDKWDLGPVDILLGRGLTQQAIRKAFPRLTVLELTVSGYDILRAIIECQNKHKADRIAIIGSDSIVYDLDTLKHIARADVKVYPVQDEVGIVTALKEAKTAGYRAIVGGLTACDLAREAGWATTVIRTSEETLQVSIKEAMNTASVMQNERAKAEISRTVLMNSREGILYFNSDGNLAQYNQRAAENLGLSGQILDGKNVADLVDDEEICNAVTRGRELSSRIKSINNMLLLWDCLPVRMEEQPIGVMCSFRRVHEIQETENRIRKQLSKKGLVAKYGFADIIHASASLAKTIATAHKYAVVDSNILLVGETGTGKELFAQSIHHASPRQFEPFVAVNCAAFPENLLESELFGYVEGAFSGASKGGKTGLFELAHNGTLFLDEIGEIPLNLQAILLRALQEGEIRRIGDDKVIPVNVRIIAATNQDLRRRAKEGLFRMDLLYRLDVLSLIIPPLRERPDDVRLIAEHYIRLYCQSYAKPILRMSETAWNAFTAYDWPGNTRELRNICERLVVLGEESAVLEHAHIESVFSLSRSPATADSPVQSSVSDPLPADVEQLVKLAGSMRVNKADLASMLGISRTTLWRRINRSGKNETNLLQ